MENFKVGDIVAATSDTRYNWTSSKRHWVGKVTEVRGRMFVAETIHCDGDPFNREYVSLDPKYFKTVNPNVIVWRRDNTTFAQMKYGSVVIKEGIAKCNPMDKYDFNVGAQLALSRMWGEAVEKEPEKKFVPYISSGSGMTRYTGIGEDAGLKDSLGNQLRIGDVCEVFSKASNGIRRGEGRPHGEHVVVKGFGEKTGYVMGIKGCCGGEGSSFLFIRRKKYYEMKHGDAVDTFVYHLEDK